jgi:hypothetical protein
MGLRREKESFNKFESIRFKPHRITKLIVVRKSLTKWRTNFNQWNIPKESNEIYWSIKRPKANQENKP